MQEGRVMQMHRQMRYYIAVVETNSFFEAGEICHISQYAISQQIKALEEEAGTASYFYGPLQPEKN